MGQSEVEPVRLGIVGAGVMGGVHAACARRTPEAVVAGVWSRSRSRAAALAEEAGAPIFDTLEALLDSPGIDAVIICTPRTLWPRCGRAST